MNPLAHSLRRAAALAATIALAATSAQAIEAWSAAGTTGAIDDGSTTLLQLSGTTIQFQAGKIGTATVRYQVADVFPDAANPSPKWLGLRFRDSGLDSRIRATLYQQNWTTGLVTSLGPVWDSDTMAASASFQSAWRSDCTLALDFYNNSYWVDVTLTRTTTVGTPAVQQVRMDNFNCTLGALGAQSGSERQ